MPSRAGCQHNEKMIMQSADRMAFGGPQVPSDLLLGGYVIYACIGGRFELTVDDAAMSCRHIAIIPPYTKHSVTGPANLRSILIEAETVSPEILRDRRFSGREGAEMARLIDAAFERSRLGSFDVRKDSFDLYFFGERLPQRDLDPRVVHVLGRLLDAGSGTLSEVPSLAREVGLSPSRLRHLFCEQVGVSIRSFRAWKRLRNTICLALEETNLLELAMAAGYADSTHLCHTVKLYFGEQPTFVRSHWRDSDFLQLETSEFPVPGRPANDGLGGARADAPTALAPPEASR
jgi:AraC-like DNA-binding protein